MITKIKLLACSAFRRVIIRLVRRKLAFFKVLQFYNACFDIQDISCYKVFADEELLSEKGLIGYSRNILQYVKEPSEAEAFLGRGFNASTEKTFRLAMKFKKPMFLAEDGFVRSLYPASATADLEYKEARSMTFDSKAFYFVGGCSSNLEDMLARSSLSREQISEARRLISLILDHNISKYNAQNSSAQSLNISRGGALVIEQSYGDQSLAMGCVEKDVFSQMLADAVRENPDRPVYFKRHPDNCARGKDIDFPIPERVHVVNDIPPLELLQYVDQVYVATSQLGFEALMMGKTVKVYGIPFYSHWGLTEDVKSCTRRKKKRTIEELFYIAYVQYTRYMSPKGPTSLEHVVNEIVTQRQKVFG